MVGHGWTKTLTSGRCPDVFICWVRGQDVDCAAARRYSMRFASHLLVAIGAATIAVLVTLQVISRRGNDGLLSLEDLEQSTPLEVAGIVLPTFSSRLVDRVVGMSFGWSNASESAESTSRPEFVSFRLRAKNSGFRGVCVADNLTIGLKPRGSTPAALGKAAPDGQHRTFRTYRVVGDTSPEHDWSERYGAELDRRCGALDSDAEFFFMTDDDDLRTLVDVLPALNKLASSPEESLPQVRCSNGREKCPDAAREILKALSWGRLLSVSPLIDCEEGEACLEIEVADQTVRGRVWTVRAKGRYSGAFPNGWGKIMLTSVEAGAG